MVPSVDESSPAFSIKSLWSRLIRMREARNCLVPDAIDGDCHHHHRDGEFRVQGPGLSSMIVCPGIESVRNESSKLAMHVRRARPSQPDSIEGQTVRSDVESFADYVKEINCR